MRKELRRRPVSDLNLLRLLRSALALLLFYEAWKGGSILPAGIGAILLWQALRNKSCCGMAGCDTDHADPKHPSSEKKNEAVTFEEVK